MTNNNNLAIILRKKYESSGETVVSVAPVVTGGDQIATITVNGNLTSIYAPSYIMASSVDSNGNVTIEFNKESA